MGRPPPEGVDVGYPLDPHNKLVMVNTSVHKLAVDVPPLEEMAALWIALVRQLGR